MTRDSLVRARVDPAIKAEASAVLSTMGLTVADAFRFMLERVARDKALPFEAFVPNAESVEDMKAARRGELETVTLADLQAVLDADD